MNYYQTNYPEEFISTDPYESAAPTTGIGTLFAPSRSLNTLQKETTFYAMKDRCRALLAKTALEHTAALSMMEQQAAEMAPGNADEFREIVKAYASGASNQLRRW